MKILAIASAGGHWIELLRLMPVFDNEEVVYISTKESFGAMVPGHEFFCVPDSSRWNKLGLLKTLWSVHKLIKIIKPDVVISTGAAPGLMAIFSGRYLGAKTIWVDALSQVDKLSVSGKIAKQIANKTYTQWPDLAKGDICYSGSVIA